MKLLLWINVIVIQLLNPVSSLNYQISEELPANSYIANLLTDSNLQTLYTIDQLGKVRFSFLQKPGISTDMDPSNFFDVDSMTGILKTAIQIDRDVLCANAKDCLIEMDIAISPVELFNVIPIKVNVSDINDNNPKFPSEEITISISESVSAMTQYSLSPAEDIDSKINSLKSYKLLSVTENFRIDYNIGPGDINELHLIVLRSLDREKESEYEVVIAAYDRGKPSRSGTVVVKIDVDDSNDNPPQFEKNFYQLSIPEDTDVNVTLMSFKAYDNDEGANGDVRYMIENKNNDHFEIDSYNGNFCLKKHLDHETNSLHHITIIAHDLGDPKQITRATLTVNVIDVNDNSPIIAVNTMNGDGIPHFVENEPLRTFIAHISASDMDTGAGGQVACDLNDPSDAFELEVLQLAQYKLMARRSLDREIAEFVEVSIVCKDHGFPSMTKSFPLTIQILDKNDNPPIFAKEIFIVTVTENNDIGLIITQFNATDLDSGDNGKIRYQLNGFESEFFDLHAVTGHLKASRVFDFENKQKYEFEIIAQDMGSPPMKSTVNVQVNVIDENDNAPVFNSESYIFYVPENRNLQMDLGTLLISDRDGERHRNNHFKLEPSDDAAKFILHPTSGILKSENSFDREDKFVYNLLATAYSIDNPNLSSSVGINVYVQDENDNSPSIKFPSNNLTFTVYSDVDIGFLVTKIIVSDPDENENSLISYTILKGNQDFLFGIEQVSGALRVVEPLNEFLGRFYHMYIIVKDNGSPSLSTDLHLNVMINESIYIPGLQNESFLGLVNRNIVITIVTICVLLIIILIISIIILRSQKCCCKCLSNPQTKNSNYAEINKSRSNSSKYMSSSTNSSSLQNTSIMTESDLKNKQMLNSSLQIGSEDGDKVNYVYLTAPLPPYYADINEKNFSFRSDSPTSFVSFHPPNTKLNISNDSIRYAKGNLTNKQNELNRSRSSTASVENFAKHNLYNEIENRMKNKSGKSNRSEDITPYPKLNNEFKENSSFHRTSKTPHNNSCIKNNLLHKLPNIKETQDNHPDIISVQRNNSVSSSGVYSDQEEHGGCSPNNSNISQMHVIPTGIKPHHMYSYELPGNHLTSTVSTV